MSDYPEHDKLAALNSLNDRIGEFIEWFEQDGRALAEHHKHTEECDPPRDEENFRGHGCGLFAGGLHSLYTYEPPGHGARIDRILALYFKIDRDKLEREKLAMLGALRKKAS